MKFCRMSLFYLIVGFVLLTTFLFAKENDFAEGEHVWHNSWRQETFCRQNFIYKKINWERYLVLG